MKKTKPLAKKINGHTYKLGAWEEFRRYPRDALWYSVSDITCNGTVVGRMFSGPGSSYPDRYSSSINQLRWAGPMSTKFSDLHIFFDVGPEQTMVDAFQAFINRAEGIFAWRICRAIDCPHHPS